LCYKEECVDSESQASFLQADITQDDLNSFNHWLKGLIFLIRNQ